MEFELPNLAIALPEMVLAILACAILLIDAFLDDARRVHVYRLSQGALWLTLLIVLAQRSQGAEIGFGGHYVRDGLSDLLKLLLLAVSSAGLLYARDYLSRRGLLKGEYFVLSLCATLGMMVLVSAHSLLTLYLGIELLSLSLYALVAFDRDSPVASEAAMKYFVLGALASGILLYGISMIYGAVGSIDLAVVAEVVRADSGRQPLFAFGLVFLVVGVAFKLGAVPFHMWVPDIYQGAPTAVTLLVGSAPKLAAFAMAIRLLGDALGDLHGDWQPMLVILSVLSMGLGNLLAIAQSNIKRMLAYSTIAHVGYLLLGVLAGSVLGYSAALFYTVSYVIMVTGAFGVILLLSRRGFESDQIEDFKGLNRRSPWVAFLMLLLMFSMAGVPPLVGFHAKVAVLSAVVDAGLVWVAVLGVVFSVIGAFYYLRVVKFMYFDEPRDEQAIEGALDVRVVLSANGLLMLLLGIYPAGLMAACLTAVL